MREGCYIPSLDLLYSVDNGIIFVSNHNKENYVFSTRESNSNVKTVAITKKEYEEKYRSENDTKIDNFFAKLNTVFNIVMVLTIIILLLFAPRENLILTIIITICRLFCLLLMLAIVCSLLLNLLCREKSSFKYHGAEHMVANAYEDLGRIPTRKEVEKYSRFNKMCGGNFAVTSFLNCICLYFCTYLSLIYGAIVFFLVLILTFYGYFKGFFNFIQKFTTEPPTEQELEVALEGLKLWFEKETEF